MTYDFDRIIERQGTNSTKWDRCTALFGREDVLPMWVADMDFACPEPVLRAIKERTDHPTYGYSFPPASLYESIMAWYQERYGWKLNEEWILFTAGVVNALYTAVEAFSEVGDQIIIQSPVYPPFFSTIRNLGRHVLNNQLLEGENGYRMDWDDLEKKLSGHNVPLMILCSPHNPVGRVWSKEELSRLAQLCLDHNCLLISDEIHCDLLLWDNQHIATSTLSSEVEERTITLGAASKTFNLAGLATSYVIIPDDELRKRFVRWRAGDNQGNMFGYIAMEAAYSQGGDYLKQLMSYLEGNMRFFADSLAERLPQLRMSLPDATYLAWVDMRELGLSARQLTQLLCNEARLGLNAGEMFGPGGEGFQRFNLGCPRRVIAEAVSRLEGALQRF